jgi:CheY-like chemotaxis protein
MIMSRKAPQEPRRALLVDDNSLGNIVRKALLEEIGLTVETALNGEEAWQMFSCNPFDLVVTDFRMPGMNGTELIARIRSTGHPTRMILLTGCSFLGLTEETTGADVVMWKSNKEGEHLQRTAQQLLTRRPKRKPVASEQRNRLSVARSG